MRFARAAASESTRLLGGLERMAEDRFLSDAYRGFLAELRRTEQRIVAASQPGAEVASPDPREVRGRLDRQLDAIEADAVTAHRDTTAQDFRVALSVIAGTGDALLGRLTGWDGAATFREPSKERLAVDRPVPEGLPEDLVDQILAQLGRAAAEAGGVVESQGEQTVRAGTMNPDLARVYLLRLWVVVPDDLDETGERSLVSLRARLSAQMPVIDSTGSGEGDDLRIFPDAYRRKAATQDDALLPAVRPWVFSTLALAAIILALGAFVWLDTTSNVRTVVQDIIDPRTGVARSKSSASGAESPAAAPATEPAGASGD
ncbi:MAG: hypothetical protein AAGE94_17655 [Acidobacteriota bacterium]